MFEDTAFNDGSHERPGKHGASLPANLREYAAECERYLSTLSPEEVERMKAMGLLHQERKNGKPTGNWVLADTGLQPAKDTCEKDDAATIFGDSTKLSETPDMAREVDRLADMLMERFALDSRRAKRLARLHKGMVQREVRRETSLQLLRVIGFFMLPGNLLIRAHALAHAARMAASSGFTSLRESARATGASVEAIRKVTWKWIELLKLPSLEGAKSAEARESYRNSANTKHWRHQKCTLENLSEARPPKT